MTIHRMRTIGESVEIIKGIDQDSAITANCIRSLCKDGKVHLSLIHIFPFHFLYYDGVYLG